MQRVSNYIKLLHIVTTLEIGGKTSPPLLQIIKKIGCRIRYVRSEEGIAINFDINNQKPYLTSVAVFLRVLSSVLCSWRYVGTVHYIYRSDYSDTRVSLLLFWHQCSRDASFSDLEFQDTLPVVSCIKRINFSFVISGGTQRNLLRCVARRRNS